MKNKPGFYMDQIGPFIVYPDRTTEYYSGVKWIKSDCYTWLHSGPDDELIWDFT
jgi:hypothetical protein